jgi:uncharacterized RDD family membrane protein YckC
MSETVVAEELEYAGFWVRGGAAIIDSVICIVAMIVFLVMVSLVWGTDVLEQELQNPYSLTKVLEQFLIPAMLTFGFWMTKQATPGKIVVGVKILDAETGEAPTVIQWAIRYLGYIVSTIPLGLGLIWAGFDDRKQAWHDKLAGTVVVRSKHRGPVPVKFGDGN